jgi:thioredoxin-like negative regulator of GroEL
MTIIMKDSKIVTIAVVACALAMFLGFMGWMSWGRYAESQSPVREVRTLDQFGKELQGSTQPVFVFFYTKQSALYEKQLPLIELAAKDYQGKVTFLKVNTDNLPEAALSLGIDQAPALIVLKWKEKTIVGVIGFLDIAELKKMIDDGINAQPKPAPAQPNPQPAPAQPNPQAAPAQPDSQAAPAAK